MGNESESGMCPICRQLSGGIISPDRRLYVVVGRSGVRGCFEDVQPIFSFFRQL